MGKEIVTQVQEVKRISDRINPRRKTLRHTVIKLTKIIKDKNINKGNEGKVTYKGIPLSLSPDFTAETV